MIFRTAPQGCMKFWLPAALLMLTVLVSACGYSAARVTQSLVSEANVDTRTLTNVGILSELRVGDSFIWGYYPGGGSKPRMYEGYVKLPRRQGKPTLALLTLFPGKPPAGVWVVHDGIGFDYEEVVAAFSSPMLRGSPREQMYGWDARQRSWFPSTGRPNTSGNTEKFNYRGAVSSDSSLAWVTKFACYNGRAVVPVSAATGTCTSGETVFQQVPLGNPSYVFLPYYSLATNVTLFKNFNETSSDPDANVAMRLVYAQDRGGEQLRSDGGALLPEYVAAFKVAASFAVESNAD